MLCLQPRSNPDACAFSIRNRIHNFAAAVRTIPAGKELRIRGLASHAIDKNATPFKLNRCSGTTVFRKKTRVRPLPDRQNNKIRSEHKLRTAFRNKRAIFRRDQFRQFNPLNSLVAMDTNRLNMPKESNPFVFGMSILKLERRHLFRTAPVSNMHFTSAQPRSRDRRVDSGVSCADDYHSSRHRSHSARLVPRDEIKRIRHSVEVLSCYSELMNRSKPNPQKDRIVFAFYLG